MQLRAFRASTLQHTVGSSASLPTAPFLVSAVSDGLLKSKYKSCTRTVPCEAETYCTKGAVTSANNIILTNDSDMILLAGASKVMFLNDIQTRTLTKTSKVLSGECYDSTEIRKDLQCQNLVMLGYMLTKHPNSTLKDLAKRLTNDQILLTRSEAGYKHFHQSYMPPSQYSPIASAAEGSSNLVETLQHLDARVSEFVHDWGSCISSLNFSLLGNSSSLPTGESDARHMFLPFLIDDPGRASAWKPSSSLRSLAYSILSLHGPRFKMMEVDRRGDRILGVEVPLTTSPASTTEECQSVLDTLRTDRGPAGNAESWRVFSVWQVLLWIKNEGSALPRRAHVLNLCRTAGSITDWEIVHFSAQVQGHLYSLRILKQILEVYLAAGVESDGLDTSVLEALVNRFFKMPNMPELMSHPGSGLCIDDAGMAALDTILSDTYPEELTQVGEGAEEKKKRKKKRSREEESGGKRPKPTKVASVAHRNPYDLLSEM